LARGLHRRAIGFSRPRHDDQVDALTQGLAWGRVRRGEYGVSYYAIY